MKIATMSSITLDAPPAPLKDARNALPQPNVLPAKKAVVTIWMKGPEPVSPVS